MGHCLQIRSGQYKILSWKVHVSFVAEYLSRPSDPLCVAVWADRGKDHQQAGGGPHVQGGDHPQGRLHARPSPPNTEPILQHRHPRNIPSLCVFGMFNIMSEIDSFHELLFISGLGDP